MECDSENLKENKMNNCTNFHLFKLGDYIKINLNGVTNIGQIIDINFDNYDRTYVYLKHLVFNPFPSEGEQDESRGYRIKLYQIEKVDKQDAYMLANSYKSKPNCVNNYTENILKDIKDLLWKYGVK